MFATLYQLTLCYLLRFIIIPGIHGAFSLSISVYVQNIGTQKFLLRSLNKVLILESCESLKSFSTGRKNFLIK